MTSVTGKKVLLVVIFLQVSILFPARAHKHIRVKFRTPSCLSKMKDKTFIVERFYLLNIQIKDSFKYCFSSAEGFCK